MRAASGRCCWLRGDQSSLPVLKEPYIFLWVIAIGGFTWVKRHLQEALRCPPCCKALEHLQYSPTWRSELKPCRAGNLPPYVEQRRKVTEVHWAELLGCFQPFPLFRQRKSKRTQQQRLRDSNQGYGRHGRKNNALFPRSTCT